MNYSLDRRKKKNQDNVTLKKKKQQPKHHFKSTVAKHGVGWGAGVGDTKIPAKIDYL